MSNSLAHFLREKGIKPNDIVPIIAKRSWHIIVAMLGIMKAGGAYMPIATECPKDRIQTILSETKSKIGFVLDYNEQIDDIEFLKLNDLESDMMKEKPIIKNLNKTKDLCYVIFTSGSTGLPKGVMIRHENVINTIFWRLGSSLKYDICSVSNIITDTFSEDILCALIGGQKLYFINNNKDIEIIADFIQSKNGEVEIMTTPSFFDSISAYIKRIKKATLVGERLSDIVCKKVLNKAEILYNEYGPSECSICATRLKVKEAVNSIGKPIANTQIYILDKKNHPLPIGVAGELCIAGAGVGKGYLNRPELTAEKFVPNPFATKENHHGEVMYHTGGSGLLEDGWTN